MGKHVKITCDNNGCGRDASKGYGLSVVSGIDNENPYSTLTVKPSPFESNDQSHTYVCGRVCLAVLINHAIDRLDERRKEKVNAENI